MAYTTKYSYPLVDFLTPYPVEEELLSSSLNSNLHKSQIEGKSKIQKKPKDATEFDFSRLIETAKHFLDFISFQRDKDSHSKVQEEVNQVDYVSHVCNIDGTLIFTDFKWPNLWYIINAKFQFNQSGLNQNHQSTKVRIFLITFNSAQKA